MILPKIVFFLYPEGHFDESVRYDKFTKIVDIQYKQNKYIFNYNRMTELQKKIKIIYKHTETLKPR